MIYNILLIYICCAFLGLDNKLSLSATRLKLPVVIYNGNYAYDTQYNSSGKSHKTVLISTQNYSAFGNVVPVHHTTKMEVTSPRMLNFGTC
jgi:hypothetical protein